MTKITKEPLFVFLLLGGVIFALFQLVSVESRSSTDEIIINDRQVQLMRSRFKAIWQRTPTSKELAHLIENHVREEVLYREAKAMGLDQNDPIIKRRLRQKLEFLSEDIIKLDIPSDQVLQAFLTAHMDNYLQPSRTTFHHLYFDTKQRGKSVVEDAQKVLKILQAGKGGNTNLGDPLNLKHEFINRTETEISRTMGIEFTKSLRELPVGSWQGLIKSGFGLHLVRVDERIGGRNYSFGEVRQQLIQDWKTQERERANEAYYASLLKRYNVKVENHANTKPSSTGRAL